MVVIFVFIIVYSIKVYIVLVIIKDHIFIFFLSLKIFKSSITKEFPLA